jgi:hypothetical protein
MPQPGELRVIVDFTRPKEFLKAQRQGHEPGDARHPTCLDLRSSFDRTCGCLAALAHSAAEPDLAYNRLR